MGATVSPKWTPILRYAYNAMNEQCRPKHTHRHAWPHSRVKAGLTNVSKATAEGCPVLLGGKVLWQKHWKVCQKECEVNGVKKGGRKSGPLIRRREEEQRENSGMRDDWWERRYVSRSYCTDKSLWWPTAGTNGDAARNWLFWWIRLEIREQWLHHRIIES